MHMKSVLSPLYPSSTMTHRGGERSLAEKTLNLPLGKQLFPLVPLLCSSLTTLRPDDAHGASRGQPSSDQ